MGLGDFAYTHFSVKTRWGEAVDDSQLDRLRVVAETATYLELNPESAPARRRRDEAVIRAARFHPVEEVATAAGVPTATLLEIVLGNLVHTAQEIAPAQRRSVPHLVAAVLRRGIPDKRQPRPDGPLT